MQTETAHGTRSPSLILFLAKMANWLAITLTFIMPKKACFPYQLFLFFFSLSLSQISSGHYGNTADRCQDAGSLKVGVQLRPPPPFISAGLPSPLQAPVLPDLFFQTGEEWLTTPVSKQATGEGGWGAVNVEGGCLNRCLNSPQTCHATVGLWSNFIWASKCGVCLKKKKTVLTSWCNANHSSVLSKFPADWVAGFEHTLLQEKSI